MRRHIIHAMVILAVATAQQATARIGETEEECTARYGQPTKIDREKNVRQYTKGGLWIYIQFHEGKAELIGFRKLESDILGSAAAISDNQVDSLLKANGGKREWKKQDTLSMGKDWQTEDGELLAHIDSDNYLMICTKGYVARQAAKKKEKEDRNLQGF